MKTDEIEFALGKKYDHEAYAFMLQVRNGTGFDRIPKTADAIAMGLWPSRGIELEGFEIKSTRQDWTQNELKNPAKAESIAKYCDRWWLVIGDEKIVHDGELPKNWGLMVPGKRGYLKVKVPAPSLKPIPMDRLFLAAMMRRFTQVKIPYADAKKIRKDGYEDGKKAAKRDASYEYNNMKSALERYKAFEESLGIKIDKDSWNQSASEKGRLFKKLIDGDFIEIGGKLFELRNKLTGMTEEVQKQIDLLSVNDEKQAEDEKLKKDINHHVGMKRSRSRA